MVKPHKYGFKFCSTVGGGYYGTEDYGTARALFAQTLDLFIFRALRDRGLRDTSKAVKYSENQNFLLFLIKS